MGLMRLSWLVFALAPLWCGACASSLFVRGYSAGELRHHLAERAPELAGEDLVIPFEVSPADIEYARRLVADAASDSERAERLFYAITSGGDFGVRYAPDVTATSAEALAARRGNCLSLASVFVGLGRALGLRAFYVKAFRDTETVQRGQMIVRAGHVTAAVATGKGPRVADFAFQFGLVKRYEVMHDWEVVAHYHNNLGYDALLSARERKPRAWDAAARHFRIATRIAPAFFGAWNNLGLAQAHLGRHRTAENSYRRAIALDARQPSPHVNLGVLLFRRGQFHQAAQVFERAAELDGDSSHIRVRLGEALLRDGRVGDAYDAFRRAVELDQANPRAERFIGKIEAYRRAFRGPFRR